MELPDLGKNCSFRLCQQLDFLPYRCDRCLLIFCGDHRKYDDHSCEVVIEYVNEVPSCPICKQPISIKKGQDIDKVVSEHIEQGCPTVEKPIPSFECCVPRCKVKELIKMNCSFCGRNFCIKHLQPTSHQCDNDPQKLQNTSTSITNNNTNNTPNIIEEAKRFLTETLSKYKNKNRKKGRKGVPVGDNNVPRQRRINFEIIFPLGDGERELEPKLMFFDLQKKVGQIIDSITKLERISNFNNVMGEKKLYLISLKDGRPLLSSKRLSECELEDGDSLLLERLDDIDDMIRQESII